MLTLGLTGEPRNAATLTLQIRPPSTVPELPDRHHRGNFCTTEPVPATLTCHRGGFLKSQGEDAGPGEGQGEDERSVFSKPTIRLRQKFQSPVSKPEPCPSLTVLILRTMSEASNCSQSQACASQARGARGRMGLPRKWGEGPWRGRLLTGHTHWAKAHQVVTWPA